MKSKIKKIESDSGFTLRGLENTRIESLSDGVFAIAIGMLLISTSPPNTFDELLEFLRNFLPFAATISILMLIWHDHYLFFIRFGMKDQGTIAMNTVVLFLVLFYTYPLKFMFGLLIDLYVAIFTKNEAMIAQIFTETISPEDTSTLMVIYGLGASAIFMVFVWLNKRALNCKEKLELSPLEIQITKNTILTNAVSAIIPFVSAMIALFNFAGDLTFAVSGFIYISYSFAMPLAARYGKKKIAQLAAKKAD